MPYNYWKLKAKILEIKELERKVEDLKFQAFTDAGLDTTKQYRLNDDTESIEEITNETNK